MLISILGHTPLWVWGLLAALVGLGLMQARPRRVARMQLLLLPVALSALGLVSLAPGFAAQPLAAGLWLGALAASAWLGLRLPRPAGAVWRPALNRLQLPGSWMPLAMAMTIFSLRYVLAVALALHPQARAMASVQWPLALVFGGLSGLFLGRALGLLALTRGAPPEHSGARPRLQPQTMPADARPARNS
jgi:hypothetical protein